MSEMVNVGHTTSGTSNVNDQCNGDANSSTTANHGNSSITAKNLGKILVRSKNRSTSKSAVPKTHYELNNEVNEEEDCSFYMYLAFSVAFLFLISSMVSIIILCSCDDDDTSKTSRTAPPDMAMIAQTEAKIGAAIGQQGDNSGGATRDNKGQQGRCYRTTPAGLSALQETFRRTTNSTSRALRKSTPTSRRSLLRAPRRNNLLPVPV